MTRHGWMIIALLIGATMVVPTASAARTKGCHGRTCNGKDPAVQGCAADAKVVESREIPDTGGQARIERRRSAKCGTEWARLVYTEQVVPESVLITSLDGHQAGRRTTGNEAKRGILWSPMLEAGKLRACVAVSINGNGLRICTGGDRRPD